jgi:hypothetical protein
MVGRMMQLCSLLRKDPAADMSLGLFWLGTILGSRLEAVGFGGWCVLVGRMMQLCSLLGRDPAAEVRLGSKVTGRRPTS